jgi:leucyl/phenylalanyl-tRNA--protein transferase
VSFNQAFSDVIRECARIPRKDQPGTWITPDLIKGYEKLFQAGEAYSVEVWEEDKLVSGLYGVVMGDFCSGESMFTKVDNGSKLALYSLTELLKSKGLKWLDTQMITSVVEHFGGEYIERDQFITMLDQLDWSKKRAEIFGV